MRRFSLLWAALLLGLPGIARPGVVYTDNFDAPDQSLSTYSTDYTFSNCTAVILNNRLRIHSPSGTGQYGVTTVTGLFPTPGPGSFIKTDINFSGTTNVFAKLGGNVAYRASTDRSGFWDNGWTNGGSTQVTANNQREYVVLYVGGTGTNQTAHLFINGQYNTSFTDDNDNAGLMVGPTGDTAHLRFQGGSGTGAWAEFDNLIVYNLPHNGPGSAADIKSGLFLTYSDDFNRADSTTIGPAWTEEFSHPTQASIDLVGGQVRLNVTNGTSTPWARAVLDLTDPSILGRGLEVGEYIEFEMRRLQQYGILGLRDVGANTGIGDAGSNAAATALRTYGDRFGTDQGSQWNPITPSSFNPGLSEPVTVGVLLDYADGDFVVTHYYINGDYAGSWLNPSASLTLDTLGLFAQTGQSGNQFVFDNLSIYTLAVVPEPATLALLGAGVLALARRRRRVSSER